MKKISFLFLFILLLTGCAGSPVGNLISNQRNETTRDRMQSWVGASADELLSSWGPPSSQSRLSNGSHLMVYESSWDTYRKGGTYSFYTNYCSQKFLIERNIVSKWGISGGCKRYPKNPKLLPATTAIPEPTLP